MKIICDYKSLLSALTNISVVAEDSNSVEDIKNIIFYVDKTQNSLHDLTLIGINNYIVYKQYLSDEDYKLEPNTTDNDIMYMQIKTKDLMSVLRTYSGLYRTKPETLTFQLLDSGVIECLVVERDNNDDTITKESTWTFDNVPMKELILNSIETAVTYPYVVDMNKEDFVKHITAMKDIITPNVNNYLGTVMFDETYVYAIQQAYLVFMSNKIKQKNVFVRISLTYKILQFMDKVLSKQDTFKVARNNDKLYISTTNSESFIRISDKITDYQNYVKGIEKQRGFCVDRLLLKDNLKRLALGDDNVVTVFVKPNENKITLKTQRYRQDIMMFNQININGMSEFSFEISKDIFNKILIGDDKDFSSNTYFYFCEPNNERKMAMYLTDDTEEWFTRIHVQIK